MFLAGIPVAAIVGIVVASAFANSGCGGIHIKGVYDRGDTLLEWPFDRGDRLSISIKVHSGNIEYLIFTASGISPLLEKYDLSKGNYDYDLIIPRTGQWIMDMDVFRETEAEFCITRL